MHWLASDVNQIEYSWAGRQGEYSSLGWSFIEHIGKFQEHMLVADDNHQHLNFYPHFPGKNIFLDILVIIYVMVNQWEEHRESGNIWVERLHTYACLVIGYIEHCDNYLHFHRLQGISFQYCYT